MTTHEGNSEHGGVHDSCTSLAVVATERVNVTMDKAALAAARAAAIGDNVSLSEWLSKAAWDRAVAQAARVSAEQDRRVPDELPGWDDAAADRIFGRDAA